MNNTYKIMLTNLKYICEFIDNNTQFFFKYIYIMGISYTMI